MHAHPSGIGCHLAGYPNLTKPPYRGSRASWLLGGLASLPARAQLASVCTPSPRLCHLLATATAVAAAATAAAATATAAIAAATAAAHLPLPRLVPLLKSSRVESSRVKSSQVESSLLLRVAQPLARRWAERGGLTSRITYHYPHTSQQPSRTLSWAMRRADAALLARMMR